VLYMKLSVAFGRIDGRVVFVFGAELAFFSTDSLLCSDADVGCTINSARKALGRY
jgi:hypothetical protein